MAATAADIEASNLSPFYVEKKRREAAWKKIQKWIPVNGNLYPAAARWWRAQRETQLAQERPQRDFVRSHPYCKFYYMDEAMKFLHEMFVDQAVRHIPQDVCQYIFEIALQMFILFEERKFDRDDIFAVFARIVQTERRQRAMDLAADGDFDHPDAKFWTPSELDRWWWDNPNPMLVLLRYSNEINNLASVQALFRKHVDTVALDHIYLLRACMGDPHILWQITRRTDHADLPSIRCNLTYVGPFYIVTEELDGVGYDGARDKAVLYPMSTHVWSGYTNHRDGNGDEVPATIELRMDDGGFNSSLIRVFDARFPARAPRPPAIVADAEAMDEEGTEENDANIDDDPL